MPRAEFLVRQALPIAQGIGNRAADDPLLVNGMEQDEQEHGHNKTTNAQRRPMGRNSLSGGICGKATQEKPYGTSDNCHGRSGQHRD